MKFVHGQILYRRTKNGRYLRYRVLSHHPEFHAVTVAPFCSDTQFHSHPMIHADKDFIRDKEVEDHRKAHARAKLEAKYGAFIELVKAHGTNIKTLAPLTGSYWSYPGTWQMLKACQRHGLLPKT